MRFSEGMSKGRFAEINYPEMFDENEELIKIGYNRLDKQKPFIGEYLNSKHEKIQYFIIMLEGV